MSDKQPTPEQITQAQIIHLTRRLMDQGRTIESGWMWYRSNMDAKAPPMQLREARLAFFHGCSYLFSVLMYALEEGTKETDGDMRRMDMVSNEIAKFERHFREVAKAAAQAREVFICSRCGAISHNLNDIKLGYCGACHDWT